MATVDSSSDTESHTFPISVCRFSLPVFSRLLLSLVSHLFSFLQLPLLSIHPSVRLSIC